MNVELNEEGYTLDGKWKLVPVSATKEMVDAYDKNYEIGSFDYSAYNSMIAASPKPSLQEEIVFDNDYMKITGKRIGEIEIGGEILPEFNSEKWCKQCGAPVPSVHLQNCPTLKSKL